jgi:hypothetical protein
LKATDLNNYWVIALFFYKKAQMVSSAPFLLLLTIAKTNGLLHTNVEIKIIAMPQMLKF